MDQQLPLPPYQIAGGDHVQIGIVWDEAVAATLPTTAAFQDAMAPPALSCHLAAGRPSEPWTGAMS
jgi:hypothetical protein